MTWFLKISDDESINPDHIFSARSRRGETGEVETVVVLNAPGMPEITYRGAQAEAIWLHISPPPREPVEEINGMCDWCGETFLRPILEADHYVASNFCGECLARREGRERDACAVCLHNQSCVDCASVPEILQ